GEEQAEPEQQPVAHRPAAYPRGVVGSMFRPSIQGAPAALGGRGAALVHRGGRWGLPVGASAQRSGGFGTSGSSSGAWSFGPSFRGSSRGSSKSGRASCRERR